MTRATAILLSACLVLGTASAVEGAPPDAFETARAELEEGLVGALVDVARWCQKSRVYGERDRTYERVLELRPDHAEARKWLQFQQKSGEWVRIGKYRRPNDKSKELAAEGGTRQRDAYNAFGEAALELILSEESALPLARRRTEAKRLIEVAPDVASVREFLGEAPAPEGEGWVLLETQTSARQRPELRALAGELQVGAPAPTPTEVDPKDRDLGVQFTASVANDVVRVYATTTAAEAGSIANVVHSSGAFFRSTLGVDTVLPEGFQVYVFGGRDVGQTFVSNYYRLGSSDRQRMASLASAVVGDAQLGAWCDTSVERKDAIARLTISTLSRERWPNAVQQGWVWEGLGLYLSYRLTGTRMTLFVVDAEARASDAGTTKELTDADNWIAEAAALLNGERPPRLAFLVGKKLSAMVTRDVVHSYALAAYLLEGHPGATGKILDLIEGGTSPIPAFEEVLGYDATYLDERLARWLVEQGR